MIRASSRNIIIGFSCAKCAIVVQDVETHTLWWVLSFAFETDDVKQQSGRLAYQLRYPFEDFAFDMARPKHFRDVNCKE